MLIDEIPDLHVCEKLFVIKVYFLLKGKHPYIRKLLLQTK